MKMKFWDRLLLRVGGLATLCAGGITLASGIVLRNYDLGLEKYMRALPAALIAGGAVAVVAALYELILPSRYAPHRRAFVTQPTELGELRIAVSAIENLIHKCVETHKEVKVQDMSIVNRRGAINVDMRVTMNSNVSIPHAVEQLQTQIKRYLAASSGIEVRDISVSVERAVGDASALPREPLPVAGEAAIAPVKTENTEEKPKISLHQRIFGRDPQKSEAEQMAENVMSTEETVQPAAAETPVEEEKDANPETDAAEENEGKNAEDGEVQETVTENE